jgi:hypothetical protein
MVLAESDRKLLNDMTRAHCITSLSH